MSLTGYALPWGQPANASAVRLAGGKQELRGGKGERQPTFGLMVLEAVTSTR